MKTTIKETTPPTKPVINLTEKHNLKYVILILEAHIASIGDVRPYNVILQESIKANNIDAVIPNRDSQKTMDIYSNTSQKITSQRNSSVNLVLAQMKALMKRNFNLHKRRTKPPPPPPTKTRTIRQPKKREKEEKFPQNQHQPLITNNPDRSASLRLDHLTQSLQLQLAF